MRDLGLCQPCLRLGRTTSAVSVDHILNKARGGTDDASNLEAICSPCHLEKTLEEARGSSLATAIGVDGWPIEAPIPTPGVGPSLGRFSGTGGVEAAFLKRAEKKVLDPGKQ